MHEKVSLLALIICYYLPARLIFDYVHKSAPIVIDELFHLPIGLKYCATEFSEWDNKITTLPGLYLFSSLLIAPFGYCSVYSLRYTVFFTSLINLVIVYYLRKQWVPGENKFNLLLNTFNIVTIPPVLFFSMVYYTDILSMMLVNAMILFGLKGRSFLASIFGFLAMVTRQNNAVYILFIAGYRVFGHLYNIITDAHNTDGNIKRWDLRYLQIKLRSFLKSNPLQRYYSGLLIEGLCYFVALLSMALFVYLNGGIVVGDKTAHTATVHIPQLFYFSLFAMFFGFPHACCFVLPFFKFVYNRFLLTMTLLTIIALIVVFNTIIHPYLLADNRHYLFYFWKYFLGNETQRFVMCPMYLCAMYCILRVCCPYRHSDPRFLVVYCLMLAGILCTQSLIDVRYFLTPYVIWRSSVSVTARTDLVIELLFQSAVSAFTLYTFGHKEIYWRDFDEVQRLIW